MRLAGTKGNPFGRGEVAAATAGDGAPPPSRGRSPALHLVTLVLVTLVLGVVGCGSGAKPISAGAVAIVSGQPIPRTELRAYVDYALRFYAWAYGADVAGMRATCPPSSRDAACVRVARQALLRLIEEAVIQRFAATHHIMLTGSDRAKIATQVSTLITHGTTASQLLASRKVKRAFLEVLLAREALIRKVEKGVTARRSLAGMAYHLSQYRVPRAAGGDDRRAHLAAVDLAISGKPVPGTTESTAWVARFRVPPDVRSALALARPGEFVGPFTRPTHYLVVQYLGSGVHRYGKPARLALETAYFRQWLAAEVRAARPSCFDTRGDSQPCPSPIH